MATQLMIPQDAIIFHGNELRTTSLKVAEVFGKLHTFRKFQRIPSGE
ncbi:hypothetical protein [Oceanospirillum linum]|nr:hypothetical protein [Oceanospirillum linum]SEF88697.1 hypothetical protein SAMN04489856_10326 [Oleiphilus messinensis]SMP13690.1 hypothetical protein SAMN06264348_102514 [Oceanospirillum linum]